MSDSARSMLVRLAPTIYGPTVLFTLGQSALIPLIPVLAVGMGASIGLSGIIASTMVLGQLAGNLPASWIVARAGERTAMLLGAGVGLAGGVSLALAQQLWLLTLSVFVIGFAAATFGLARHSFMTTRVPFRIRARALSFIGGSHRLGRFAGPFLTAGLLALTGSTGGGGSGLTSGTDGSAVSGAAAETAAAGSAVAVWAYAVCVVLAGLLVALAPDPEKVMPVIPGSAPVTGELQLPDTTGIRWAPLVRVGGCAAILAGLRAVKDVLLPLWGVSIGMDPTGIALVVGIAGTVDFALFYTSGQVMDRYGRLWAALPATIAMAVSFLVLSLTHDLAASEGWLIGCAAAIGVGNGLSSGIVLTLGSDLAPRGNPAPFLAAWRTLVDFGGAVTPLAVSAIAILSLPAAAAGSGFLALAGIAGFVRWIPRYIPLGRTKRS